MIEERPLVVETGESYWQALLALGEVLPPAPPCVMSSWPDPISDRAAPCSGWRPDRGARDELWLQLADWLTCGTAFDAPVIGSNKGGLLVRVCGSIGFVPASQLVDVPTGIGTPALRDDLRDMVGRNLTLRLIELDPARNRVICSERAVAWEDEAVGARLAELEGLVGTRVTGRVRSVCDFGVFVDLEGVDGLIHISELSWQRVGHPSEIVGVDDEVAVQLLGVDRASRRVALSYKRLHEDPWHAVAVRYVPGDVVDALITNVVAFGAFARVPEGVDGLIHISELADGPFEHPGEVVSEGQMVRVRVLHVDPEVRRLGLSLRQV